MTIFFGILSILSMVAATGFVNEYGPINWIGLIVSVFIGISCGLFAIISQESERVDNE